VKRTVPAMLIALFVFAAGAAAQPPKIIADVRAAIAQQDFAKGDALLAAYRAAHGVTPEMLAALSWMGRGTLAARNFDRAEAYANDTYKLAETLLATRPIDQEQHLPIAVGAAIEVLAQVDAERGARTEAITFLQRELAKHSGTSIEKRIQKNLNLLSLEGTVAPAIDVADYLGSRPPTLDSLRGKVVLMFFWAHWCGDCKAQAPVLASLTEKYGSQGLVVFAPTQRFGYVAGGKPAPADEETRYIDQVRQTSYAVLAEQPIPLSAANHLRYGVSTTPTIVLVDRAGVIRLYHPGKMTQEALEPLVKRLIEGAATRSRSGEQ
jgi:thiol-disulfide isomerase/thioredoxin